jgi:hypothetical protein
VTSSSLRCVVAKDRSPPVAAVSPDGRSWSSARRGFLVPSKALAKLVRGKLKALLGQRRPDLVLPPSVWRKPWIVHTAA